jgi:hypothetical protein
MSKRERPEGVDAHVCDSGHDAGRDFGWDSYLKQQSRQGYPAKVWCPMSNPPTAPIKHVHIFTFRYYCLVSGCAVSTTEQPDRGEVCKTRHSGRIPLGNTYEAI